MIMHRVFVQSICFGEFAFPSSNSFKREVENANHVKEKYNNMLNSLADYYEYWVEYEAKEIEQKKRRTHLFPLSRKSSISDSVREKECYEKCKTAILEAKVFLNSTSRKIEIRSKEITKIYENGCIPLYLYNRNLYTDLTICAG